MVSYEPTTDLAVLESLTDDGSMEGFEEKLSLFSLGKITVYSFYQMIVDEYFSSLSHCSHQESWLIIKPILSLIQNPERRANFHLRYLRLRPQAAYLTCCNRQQCWRCKTRDIHDGKTCDEMEALYDNGFVRCTQCLVYLVKGDGCDSVTCVCGRNFSWSTEREKYNNSRAFQDQFPTNTAQMYARVVCLANGSALCQPEIAEFWAVEHELEAINALRNWWRETYAPFQSQCTLLKHLIPPTKGASKACLYWEQTHAEEVRRCQQVRDFAINSLLDTYFPGHSRSSLIGLFDRDDFLAKAIQESMSSRLPVMDRVNLQQAIQDYRIRYHQETEGELTELFRTDDSATATPEVSESTLLSYLRGAQQFLALYGHLHAGLGHLEIKLLASVPQRNGKKKSRQKGSKHIDMNRVLGSGPVLCRWSDSKSHRSPERPFYPGVVTHFHKGLFDVDFTDGAGAHHRLGGLIFRYTLDEETSLYLPKYRCCSDSDVASPAAWMPFFFPAIPLSKEHGRLYELYCSCLRHASQISTHPWIQEDLLQFKDRTRITRGVLPLAKLLDDTIFQADYPSPKQKNDPWCSFENERDETRRRKKDKRRQIEDCRRSEKVTWRDFFRGVMWKSVRQR